MSGNYDVSIKAGQVYHTVTNAESDSVNVQVRKKEIKIPIGKPTENKPQTATNETPPAAKPSGNPAPKKAAPKPPVTYNVTSLNQTIQSNPLDSSEFNVVGDFTTNIPGFKELNMKSKQAVALAGDTAIYAPLGGEAPKVTPQEDPPGNIVAFGNGISAFIPEGQGKNTSIVYDAETKTYAFNNIEGLKLEAHATGADNRNNLGGEKFLITGGSVDEINTTEDEWKHGSVNSSGKDGYVATGVPEQTVVFNRTKIKGNLYIANDNVGLMNTELSQEQVVDQSNTQANGEERNSYVASEKGTPFKSKLGLQTGVSMTQFMAGALGADIKDVQKNLTTGTKYSVGSLNVSDAQGTFTMQMKDVSVARQVGNNLNVYCGSADMHDVTVTESPDGKTVLGLRGSGISITIDGEQPEGAKIFYDKDNKKIYMQNMQGVSTELKSFKGNDFETTLIFDHCDVAKVDTAETDKFGSNMVQLRDNAKRTNILFANGTTVDTVIAAGDRIVTVDAGEIKNQQLLLVSSNNEDLDKAYKDNIRYKHKGIPHSAAADNYYRSNWNSAQTRITKDT